MAHTIDDLIAEVQESQTLADGVKATISGLRQKVADAIANAGTGTTDAEIAAMQQAVDEVFIKLAASNDEVAAALVENTPASTGGDATGGTTSPVDTTGGGTTTTPVDTTGSPVVTPVDTTDGTPSTGTVDTGVPAGPTTPDAGPIDNVTGGTAGGPPPPSL